MDYCRKFLAVEWASGIAYIALIFKYRYRSGQRETAMLPIASAPAAINIHLRFFIPSPISNLRSNLWLDD
jgi:hypothetical protein